MKAFKTSFDSTNKDLWNIILNMLDEQVMDILLDMEKKYRKLTKEEVDYLP